MLHSREKAALKKAQGVGDTIHLNETSSNEYLNIVCRQSSKHLSNHKILFSYIKPLLYFIPSMLLSCK